MRGGVATLGLVLVLTGCAGEASRRAPGAETRRAIWRLDQLVPEELAREDVINLTHALEQFWLAVAEANPSQRSPESSAKPPEWACDGCGVVRAGSFDRPSGAPAAGCPHCAATGVAAEPIFRDARKGILGRYPTRDEGLQAIVPFLRGDPPAPDLVDPWGRPYIYVPYDDAGFGIGAVPRGKYLLYSTGPNRRDDGGGDDDISNLPGEWSPPLEPTEPMTAAPAPGAPAAR